MLSAAFGFSWNGRDLVASDVEKILVDCEREGETRAWIIVSSVIEKIVYSTPRARRPAGEKKELRSDVIFNAFHFHQAFRLLSSWCSCNVYRETRAKNEQPYQRRDLQ